MSYMYFQQDNVPVYTTENSMKDLWNVSEKQIMNRKNCVTFHVC
jgi:hypothetical protein